MYVYIISVYHVQAYYEIDEKVLSPTQKEETQLDNFVGAIHYHL